MTTVWGYGGHYAAEADRQGVFNPAADATGIDRPNGAWPLGGRRTQTSSQSQIVRPATTSGATATSGSGQYYFEFRSRQAWDYGHTFVVFGRVGGATPQE